jgi:hypothetical protein
VREGERERERERETRFKIEIQRCIYINKKINIYIFLYQKVYYKFLTCATMGDEKSCDLPYASLSSRRASGVS